ncbi:MAG: radical SAM protein [Clostridia bacterium]|nr:radical SAM protein [Clostridia bacterium]
MHEIYAKGILSPKNGMNIYRGCSHGCIYCDSRSKCYGMTHAFEDIEVKINAPELLEQALRRKKQRCMIGTGAMCDPYLHIEEKLLLTRRCLEIIDRYGFGLSIQTKSARILRDLDLLKSINEKAKCVVQMTLTTHDESLCRLVEPNVSTTSERVEVLRIMRRKKIPTVVWLCPILPVLNDTPENLLGILHDCLAAGVKGILCFGMGMTLREGDREYYYDALDRHFPGLKEKYISLYGNAYVIDSPNAAKLFRIFHSFCREHGIMHRPDEIFAYLNEFPEECFEQTSLF